jgi:hypothetical protein
VKEKTSPGFTSKPGLVYKGVVYCVAFAYKNMIFNGKVSSMLVTTLGLLVASTA